MSEEDGKEFLIVKAVTILGMTGCRLDFVLADLMAPGETSFTSDPQRGKNVSLSPAQC